MPESHHSSKMAERKQSATVHEDGEQPQQNRAMYASIEQYHQGPLPSPQQLAEYEQIHNGFAERLLTQFEENSKHIREIERLQVEKHYADKSTGRKDGLIVVVLSFACTAFALFSGYEVAASIIGGTTVVGLATIFVLGQKSNVNGNRLDDKQD